MWRFLIQMVAYRHNKKWVHEAWWFLPLRALDGKTDKAVVITAVVYDYCELCLGSLYWSFSYYSCTSITGLMGPILLSSTVKMCTALFLVAIWEAPIFFAAADLMMILRVYAMWNQSKKILYFLLFIYVPQVITSFVMTGIFNNPNTYITITTLQALNLSVCVQVANSTPLEMAVRWFVAIPQLLLSVALLVLAVIQTWKQSVDMYKATKQWTPNKYMQHLMKDESLYFLIINVVDANLATPSPTINSIAFVVSFLFLPSMMPRFVISMRELYDRDIQGRWEGIDSAFGVLSQPVASSDAHVPESTFGDVTSGQGEGQAVEGDTDPSEVIPLMVLGDAVDGTYQEV
ncbi:hypothetical protein V8E55_001919 [Tylopilus felleus]